MPHFDLCVIGSGPAGQKAAIQASKLNKSVCVIEKREVVGGASINTGTIPSKALREAILQFAGRQSAMPRDVDFKAARDATLSKIGDVLTREFELSGLFGVDFILDGEQIWPLEVNPRYTASVEVCERATGDNAIAFHVIDWPDAPSGRSRMRSKVTGVAHGKAILFARRDVVMSNEFAEMALAEALRMPWPKLADVSPAGSLIEAGRPIITVFAEGRTVDDVEQRLRLRVLELERQIYGSSAVP